MAVARDDLTVEQGTTWQETWVWLQDGEPVNLSGCQVRSHVRVSFDAEILFDLTPHLLLDPLAGEIVLEVDAVTTAGWSWSGLTRWDLEIEWPGGRVTRLLEGQIRLSREVTR